MSSKEIIITVMFTIVNIEYIIIIIKRFGMNFKNDKVFSRFTSHFSLKAAGFTSLPLDIQKSNYIHLLTCNGFLCYL